MHKVNKVNKAVNAAWGLRLVFPPARPIGRVALALCIGTIGATTMVPTTAEAAFPGANGIIVFSGSGSSGRFCGDRYHHDQLFASPGQGSSPFQLTCTPGRDVHPFVSPDGSEVVFTNVDEAGVSQLYTLPLPSAGHGTPVRPTLASDAAPASDDNASWSPAGDGTIVFQRTSPGTPTQLYVENVADPSSAAPVFPSPTGLNDTEPVFDPTDPNVLAFVRPVGGHSHILTYDLATQALTDLSAQGDGGGSGDDSKPDFSPAGSGRIVFESDRACGFAQLYTMTLQGTDQNPVFPTSHTTSTNSGSCSIGADDPVYAPQGGQLAFDRLGHVPHGGDQSHDGAYEDNEWGGWTKLSFVSVDPSGVASGAPIALSRDHLSGVEPSWGPAASPPVQTPEAPFPIILPVLGVGVAGVGLLARRRRARRRLLSTALASRR